MGKYATQEKEEIITRASELMEEYCCRISDSEDRAERIKCELYYRDLDACMQRIRTASDEMEENEAYRALKLELDIVKTGGIPTNIIW